MATDTVAFDTTIEHDGYFLSSTNPLATTAQRDSEALALRLLEAPQVQQARKKVEAWFRIAAGRGMTTEMEATLPGFIEQYVFHYAVIATNCDPNHPRVLQVYAPAHEWFGMRLPGSQFGDNPDNSYRLIPLDGRARYEVKARRLNSGLDVTYTLMRGTALTHGIETIEERDLQVAPDGTYTLTLDPEPANGRLNHIQTRPGMNFQFLYVRDSRSDWKQVPNVLTVRRLDAPDAPPWDADRIATLAAEIMIDDMPLTYWFTRAMLLAEPNVLPQPDPPGPSGGLFVQLQSHGPISVRDDHALVVTIDTRGAAYHNFVVYDQWFVARDFPHRTSSLNNAQSVANADGTYTYVVASQDPGVHNWIDTGGLHDVLAMNRNQGLPRSVLAAGRGLSLQCRLTAIRDLRTVLPQGTRWVTAEERRSQLAARLADCMLRFVDR